ncbi:hypothetical protein [Nocardioides pantholopis]|uniref:hypothetical protein n=1 Tax=Nocardioides pantholopis TaxID=2483798 RepID=UPI000F07D957|nr:hypothetical protein [Nocardioides pantholopis]
MNEQQVTELLRAEWASIPVGAPPVDAVVARAGARRRRVRGGLVAGAGAAAASVLAIVLVTGQDRGPEDVRPLGPPGPVVENPVEISWSAGEVLHLDRTTVGNDGEDEVDRVIASHARVAENEQYGAVYVDLEGDVVHVDSLGRTRAVGETEPMPYPVAASLSSGWAAWVDTTGDVAELVVHDTAEGREVSREVLPATESTGGAWEERTEVVAVDGETVWVRTPGGDLIWEPGEPLRASPYSDRWVVDAAGGTILTRSADLADSTFEYGDADGPVTAVPGGGAGAVSPDGRYVLAQRGGLGDGTDGPDDWRVYDTASGDRVPLQLPSLGVNDAMAQAAFGDGSFHLVLVRGTAPGAGAGGVRRWQIVSCELADGSCATTLDLAGDELGADERLRLPD